MDFTLKDVDKLYRLFHAIDNNGFLRADKIKGTVSAIDSKLKYITDNLTMHQVEMLCELAKVFSGDNYTDEVPNGTGAKVWTDDDGNINLVVDFLTVRRAITNGQDELFQINNIGTLQIAPGARIKKIQRR